MIPQISRNKKVLAEIDSYTKMIDKITNPRLKKDVNETLKKLKSEYTLIDNFYSGSSGKVSPGLARESLFKTVEYRRYLNKIKNNLQC